MKQNLAVKNQLAERLSSALGKDEFLLFSQAIIALAQDDKRPFQEVLIRFQEEETKLLPPGTFLPLVEEHGLMPFLDRWVINRLTKWIGVARSVKPDWKIPRNGINLSPQSLHIQGFVEFTKKHVEAGRLPPETFCFELIWEDAVEHAEALMRVMAALKPIGCRFTIARFDGVPGSFDLLKMLAPDFVKISPRVVLALDSDRPDRAVAAEAIHRECTALNIRTIAEYVETKRVLAELRRIGVHHAQGFVIQPPQALT